MIRALSMTIFISLFTEVLPQESTLPSGPAIGEECPAFDPMHVWGPDKGKKACPMCKYGYQQGVLLWLNTEDLSSIKLLAERLESEINKKGVKRIRAFIIYMNPGRMATGEVEKKLTDFAGKTKLNKVGVTYIPAPDDEETAGLYNINPDSKVKNTVIIYRSRRAFDKYINFSADEGSVAELIMAVERAEKTKKF